MSWVSPLYREGAFRQIRLFSAEVCNGLRAQSVRIFGVSGIGCGDRALCRCLGLCCTLLRTQKAIVVCSGPVVVCVTHCSQWADLIKGRACSVPLNVRSGVKSNQIWMRYN